MSSILVGLTAHVALASIAIFLVAAIAAIVMRCVRDDAVAVHRTARLALLSCLALLPLQVLTATRLLRAPISQGQRAFASNLVLLRDAPRRNSGGARPAIAEIPAVPAPVVADPPSVIARGPSLATKSAPDSTATGFELDSRLVVLAALAHLVGLLIFIGIQLRRVVRTRAFLARTRASDSEALRNAIAAAAEHSHLKRYRVRVSTEIDAPCCAGVWNPVIVIPIADLDDAALASRTHLALLHEMIHLEQRDPLIQIAERLLITMFWFHPVAWWLVRALSDARELACDQQVAERTGRRRSYARALLDYAAEHSSDPLSTQSRRGAATNTTALLHWVSWIHWKRRRSLLRRRIEMLTSMRQGMSKNRSAKRLRFAVAGGSAIAALCVAHVFVATALPAFGGESESMVAYCPPKQTAPIVLPPQDPNACDARKPSDLQKPPRDANKPTPNKKKSDVLQSPLSPEERSKRLQELLASKRGADNGARAQLVSSGGSLMNGGMNGGGEPLPMDPDVKRALIQTLLNDQHITTRATAASALAPFIREREVKDAFMNALQNSRSQQLKVTVLDELLKRETLSDDARELFVRLFAMDNDEFNRITMTEALAPYANEPDARDALVDALLNDTNESMQINAARALTSQATDQAVQNAMTKVLRSSRNEVARMAIIDALASEVAGSTEIQSVFVEMLVRDDNPVARLHVAEKLAEDVADPKVRRVVIQGLDGGVSVVIQRTLVDALSRFVREPDVKRAFIQLLSKIDNEVVRMRIVESLAGITTLAPTENPNKMGPYLPSNSKDGAFPNANDVDASILPVVNSKS